MDTIFLKRVCKDYSLEEVVKTASVTYDYLKRLTEQSGGSGYDLGEFDPTPQGMLKKMPAAINVSLLSPVFMGIKEDNQLAGRV